MKFSVLICTYNRPLMLKQALTALVEATSEKPDEIVVVNGGGDEADKVVQSFIGRHDIQLKLVKTVNVNLATSRNIGLEHCSGDIVAMTDDDAEVFPDWITQMKRIHCEQPEAGAVGGRIIGAENHSSFISRLSDIITFPLPAQPGCVHNLPGVNVSYKRIVLKQVGKQESMLFRGEDVDFNWRIRQLGFTTVFHPDVQVLHHHRSSLWKFLQQHFMYGRAYYLVRRKWPEMYAVYPRKLRTFHDYAKLANFFLAIVYEPIRSATQLKTWRDRFAAVPILIVNHFMWKFGMVYQRFLSN